MINEHWTNGGTGLTNFNPSDEQRYLDAIKAHGDTAYVVVKSSMGNKWPNMYSLHFLNVHKSQGSKDFWDTFDKVSSERSK